MTLSSRSSCISLLSSSRITRLLSHRIFYIPSTTSSCESLQRTLIYSVSILSSYPDCNAVTSANLVRCAVHALPTQSFKAGHLRQSYNQATTSDRLNFLQIPQHAPSPLEDALFDKSLRPASGTARYLSSTNWSPQMNVAPRIRTLVPRCACDSHPQPISGFLRTRSRRPSAPADATTEGPAWLAHRSCTDISSSRFPSFKRSWTSNMNNKDGQRAKSHMQIFETFRNGAFGCS